MNTKIDTYTGKLFDYCNPREEDIDLVDIAIGLCREGRYANQEKIFYSVAEHSMRVCDLAPEYLKPAALAHDFTETWFKDVPKPLKIAIPMYGKLEDAAARVVFKKFGISWEHMALIKPYDTEAYKAERAYFKQEQYEDYNRYWDDDMFVKFMRYIDRYIEPLPKLADVILDFEVNDPQFGNDFHLGEGDWGAEIYCITAGEMNFSKWDDMDDLLDNNIDDEKFKVRYVYCKVNGQVYRIQEIYSLGGISTGHPILIEA